MKKQYFRKMFAIIAAVLTAAIFITGCGIYEDYTMVDMAMGTVFTVHYIAIGSGTGIQVQNELYAADDELEDNILSRRVVGSELYLLNQSAGSQDGYELSAELEDYLLLCLELSEKTDGAFDVTVGALAELWGIDEAAMNPEDFELPSAEAVDFACNNCGYEKVEISEHRIYIPEGLIIDLGAVGKGIYLSRAHDIFGDRVKYGIVSAGGSILTYGYKDGGQPWNVGIADPANTDKVIANLRLDGSFFVSTSGDYERFVEYDGIRYHHILNVATGYPADSGISSVTAVIPTDKDWKGYFKRDYATLDNKDIGGLMSDAITTAIFVLGEEEGMKLAAEYDIEVLLVRNDGSTVMSDGMVKYIY